jgi:predicted dithiol-disulfide oxidoreductase (DUF899 family)
MTDHTIATHEQWLAARLELLAAEKEFTRQRDALTRRRMAMPWERVEKPYRFEGPDGALSLADLFDGRSQLIVYHLMFAPDWEEACKSCSFWADNFNGIPVHLGHRDVTFTAVSLAPLAKIDAYKKRMGWSFPWVSSHGSDFNFDYQASFTPEQIAAGTYYNYQVQPNKCRNRSASASSPAMRAARCSTPIPATRAASTCSMAPTTTSTWYPKAATRTISNSRWDGYADTISTEAIAGGYFNCVLAIGRMEATCQPSAS